MPSPVGTSIPPFRATGAPTTFPFTICKTWRRERRRIKVKATLSRGTEGDPPDVRLPFDNISTSFGASLMRKDPSAMTHDATNWTPSTSPMDCNMPSGDKGTSGKFNSFVCPPPPPPVLELTGLDLFHAESNRKILTLINGTVVRLDAVRPRLSSRTNVALNVVATYDATKYNRNMESVVFRLDNRHYRTEHKAPFCLCGNDKSDIFSCGIGSSTLRCDTKYSVTAIPYTGLDGTGMAGAPMTVSFSIDCRKNRSLSRN